MALRRRLAGLLALSLATLLAAPVRAGTPLADSPGAVEIGFELDAAHRLLVRYRAPTDVARLDFLLHDDRTDRVFRTPAMHPADDCGALVPGGIVLRHGAGCERGALFVVQPRAMTLDAMYEPAQPSTDGGVLFYTGYYAAAAPHAAIRWRFTPAAGDYVIDDSRRHDAAWSVSPGLVYDGAQAQGDQRESDEWLAAQHAQQYVFIGHTPMTQAGGLLWVRDPALPRVIVDTVGRAGPLAWDAYARASGRQPEGQTAVVMLSAPAAGAGYHGDRTEGHMLRLSFAQSATLPDPRDIAQWSKFIAHETAHLWNHGVFLSDQARPWLHEGDAEWAALNAMREAGLLSDRAFADELQSRVDACLMVRGDKVASGLGQGRHREDDPYGCGVALQLLGYARSHARRPDATPLAVWGALHRAHPMLDAAGFADFFDAPGETSMQALLLGADTPFAATYRADLTAVMPLRDTVGEPTSRESRLQIATRLMSLVDEADCGRSGFTLVDDRHMFVLDTGMQCKALPDGAHVTTIAGVPAVTSPRTAWRAWRHACAIGRGFEVGFDFGIDNRASVRLACPALVPDLPAQVLLPDDVLARLGLSSSAPAPASPDSNR